MPADLEFADMSSESGDEAFVVQHNLGHLDLLFWQFHESCFLNMRQPFLSRPRHCFLIPELDCPGGRRQNNRISINDGVMGGQLESSLSNQRRVRYGSLKIWLMLSSSTYVQYDPVLMVLVLKCSASIYITLGMVDVVSIDIRKLVKGLISIGTCRTRICTYL